MKDNNDYLTQPTNQNLGYIAGKDDRYLFSEGAIRFNTVLYLCLGNSNNCTQPSLGAK